MATNNKFNLTLDTVAPSLSINTKDNHVYYNQAGLTAYPIIVTYGAGTGGVADSGYYMKKWVDKNAAPTASDIPTGDWEAIASSINLSFPAEGSGYYYHVVIKDDVNNQSAIATTTALVYDNTKPTVSDIVLNGGSAISNSTTIPFSFKITESGAGIKSVVVSCSDGTSASPTAGASVSGTITVTGDNGDKVFTATITDNAGNVTTQALGTVKLDTGIGNVSVVLSGDGVTGDKKYTRNATITATVSCNDEDIQYCGFTVDSAAEPGEWQAWTTKTKSITLSAEGSHTVYGWVKDTAGNTKSATATIYYDKTNPTVTISSNKAIISDNAGYNEATLTVSATDSGSGVASWTLKVGTTSITRYTDKTDALPATLSLLASDLPDNVSSTITLLVTDKAGNEGQASCTVFKDTKIESVTISNLVGANNDWYKNITTVNVNIIGDATNDNIDASASKVYIWANNNATDTDYSGKTSITAVNGDHAYTILASNKDLSQGKNYIHAVAVDAVGNVKQATSLAFNYDNVAPVIDSVAYGKSVYGKEETPSITITVSESGSGMGTGALMNVSGSLNNPTSSTTTGAVKIGDTWYEPYRSTRDTTFSATIKNAQVTVTVIDAAGNISAAATSNAIEFDKDDPTGSAKLLDGAAAIDQPNVVNVRDFSVRMWGYDDGSATSGATAYYKVYGDLGTGATPTAEADASWVAYSRDAGQEYMTVKGLKCTTNATDTAGGTQKTIYVKFKDNAGNVSAEISAGSFFYDDSAPVVNYSAVAGKTFDRISTVHSFRHKSATELLEINSDETYFKFTVDEAVKAWKVVAYPSLDAAKTVIDVNAEGTASGVSSMLVMSGGSAYAGEQKITGAMLQAAVTNDGAYVLVIYAQNQAGTWSSKVAD